MGRRTRGRRKLRREVCRSNKRQGHQKLEVGYRQAPPGALVTERLKVATIEDQYPIRATRRSTLFAHWEAILLSCKKEHRGNIATRSAMPSPQREGARHQHRGEHPIHATRNTIHQHNNKRHLVHPAQTDRLHPSNALDTRARHPVKTLPCLHHHQKIRQRT